jgi:hypothetical protein
LPNINPRARHSLVERALQLTDQVVRVVLIIYFNDDLRVVELLHFRRHRKPESRATATDEGGKRLKNFSRLTVFSMFLPVFVSYFAYHLFGPTGGVVSGRQRRIFRQPDVEV